MKALRRRRCAKASPHVPGDRAASPGAWIRPKDVTDKRPEAAPFWRVKPLGEMEPQVAEMYQTRLPAIYQKIKP